MFFFCFSFLVWLKRDGTQRTSSFHCSSHVSSVSEGGGESNGSRIYDKSSAETCRVVRRRICTETGKVGKKKTDIYIFLYLLSFPLFFFGCCKKKKKARNNFSISKIKKKKEDFFFFVEKKKKRDDEHAGFLFLIMQGTSLLCFLIFFRLYDTQVYQKERETADYIYLCLPSPKYSLCNSASFFFFSSSPSHVSVAFSFSVFHRRLLCGH